MKAGKARRVVKLAKRIGLQRLLRPVSLEEFPIVPDPMVLPSRVLVPRAFADRSLAMERLALRVRGAKKRTLSARLEMLLSRLVCVLFHGDAWLRPFALRPALSFDEALHVHPSVFASYAERGRANAFLVSGPQRAMRVMQSFDTHEQPLSDVDGRIEALPNEVVLGLHLLTRTEPSGPALLRLSVGEIEAQWEAGLLDAKTVVRVRKRKGVREQTVGRALVWAAIPASMEAQCDRPADAEFLQSVLRAAQREWGAREALWLRERWCVLALRALDRSGASLRYEQLATPIELKTLQEETLQKVLLTEEQYNEGIITDGERYNKCIDLWATLSERLQKVVRASAGEGMRTWLVDAGLLHSSRETRLTAFAGLQSKSDGSIAELPALGSYSAGLGVHSYSLTANAVRGRTVRRVLATVQGEELARSLFRAVGRVRITMEDCGSVRGLRLRSRFAYRDEIDTPAQRALGFVLLEPVRTPEGKVLLLPGALIDANTAKVLEQSATPEVCVRYVGGCEARKGLCAVCYGVDPATDRLVRVGEYVGMRMARALASLLPEVPSRVLGVAPELFSGGDFAERSLERTGVFVMPFDGHVRWQMLVTAAAPSLGWLVLEEGSLVLEDSAGELTRVALSSGDTVLVADGAFVSAGIWVVERSGERVPPVLANIPEGASASVELYGVQDVAKYRTELSDRGETEYVADAELRMILRWGIDQQEVRVYAGDRCTCARLVRRGDVLVRRSGWYMDDRYELRGPEHFVEWLNDLPRERSAVLARAAGGVVLDRRGARWLGRVLDPLGRTLQRFWLDRRESLRVPGGSLVLRGEQLTIGRRKHRTLASLMGAPWIFEHLYLGVSAFTNTDRALLARGHRAMLTAALAGWFPYGAWSGYRTLGQLQRRPRK